jgi:hypothetical protein
VVVDGTVKKIEKEIRACAKRVQEECAQPQGKYGRGLAYEGFAGGYLAALEDVLLLLHGNDPSPHRRYWEDWRRIQK